MQPLRLDENIRPPSAFGSGVASLIKLVSDIRRPSSSPSTVVVWRSS